MRGKHLHRGKKLHEYDLSLCEYAVGNVRQYLDNPAFERYILDQLMPSSLENIITRSSSDVELEMLLGVEEFDELIGAFEVGPFEFDRKWEPYKPLHRRYLATIREIRDGLSAQAAEDWSKECAEFAAHLEHDSLGLHDGLQIVWDWVYRLRQYLSALGATEFLPYPDGSFPSPTHPNPSAPTEPGSAPSCEPPASELADAIRLMRAAIAKIPDGAKAKVWTLRKEAGIANKRAREALRWLEARGEYQGFGRDRPHRYKPK